MLAARLYKPYDLRVEDVPEPGPPPPGWVKLRIASVGVCGSDLHYYREGGIGPAEIVQPLIMGHEFSAFVTELGEGVDNVTVGQLTAVDPNRNCGTCEQCEMGHPNLCPNVIFAGSPGVDGAMRETMNWPANLLFPLPPALSATDGALLEPLGIALHAVRLGDAEPGDTVAVLGAGPIGLSIMSMLHITGPTTIYGTEPLAYRRDAAMQFGATAMFDPSLEDVVEAIVDATGGRGADVVFEAAGAAETPVQAAKIVKIGGTVVIVGIPTDNTLCFHHSDARRKGLTIKMSRRMKHTYPQAIALTASGQIDMQAMATHHFPLSESVEAFELVNSYADNVLKAVIDVS